MRRRVQVAVRRAGGSAGVLVVSSSLIAALRTIRLGEATASRHLLALLGIPTRQIGTTVVVGTGSGPAGFTVSSGCSSALLLLPFALLAGALVASGRVRARTGGVALLGAALALPLINQVRFAVIGASIGRWGFDRGYAPAHVIAGTIVSTVGLAAALAAFVRCCLRPSRHADPAQARPT